MNNNDYYNDYNPNYGSNDSAPKNDPYWGNQKENVFYGNDARASAHFSARESDTLGQFARVMSGVYGYMTLGLLITAVCAYVVASSPVILETMYSSGLFFALVIGELVLVIALSAAINKLSVMAARVMFFAYAALNGATLSILFLRYEIGSIVGAFATTAAMFGVMSVVGLTTKKNLTSIGSYMLMALIGLIVASVVNLFLGNGMLDFVICIVGIIIFVALTAYDTQKIKNALYSSQTGYGGDTDAIVQKVTVIGALNLYLDFINIFLKVLRIIGKRR